MAREQRPSRPTMHEPAVYRIHVRGRLAPAWSRWVEGMTYREIRGADGGIETILSGCLADQAAFIGVINTLYNLHLPVIAATFVGNE